MLRPALALLLLALAAPASARATDPPAPAADPAPAPFLLRLGRIEIQPYVRVGALTLDTNVFYTSGERTTDVYGSGGPGLRVGVPMGGFRLSLDGNLDYTHYFRTEELRRLGGSARADLEWRRGGVSAGVGESYTASYSRPDFEVDRRIFRDQWSTNVHLAFSGGGRLGLGTSASIASVRHEEGQEFLGTDLSRTLDRDTYSVAASLTYRLTPKTALVLDADHQADRFTRSPARDVDSNRLAAGLELESSTRLFGRAVGGVRLFRPVERGGSFAKPYLKGLLGWHFGPRTVLSVAYDRDPSFSAFDVAEAYPLLDTQRVAVRLGRRFTPRIDLQLEGSWQALATAGEVTLVDAGSITTARRDDDVFQASADLGYALFDRLRVGLKASYTERQSTFGDLGLDGLLLGLTVRYQPPQPF